MILTPELAVAVAAVGATLTAVAFLVELWLGRRRAGFRPEPEDGGGCVELWEAMSALRRDDDQDS